LLSRTHSKGSEVLDAQAYVYDAAGRRASSQANSNRALNTAAATGQYDAANQLKLFGGRSYTHDANGNRLSETGLEGQTTYNWDARNRLQSVVGPDGQTTSFLYDFSGNLMQQRVAGAGGEFTRTFVLDNMTNVALQSSSTGEQLSFLTGGGIDEHLAAVDASGKVSFALPGTLGSVVANTGATGAVEGRASYEPFGKTTTTGAQYPFEYSGRYRVAENLYYYRARYYDPVAGRFLSEDPLGMLGGNNLYQFNRNDPINHTDPLGLWAGLDDAVAAGLGALGGLVDQGIQDVFNGELSGWEDYAGAAVGGAATGETFLYTGNPFLAGAAGGAAGNLTTQGLKNLTGKQCGFDTAGFIYETGAGGIESVIGDLKIPGINKGRGSFKAVERQIITKFERGQIRRISAKTAGKIITAEGVEFGLDHGPGVAFDKLGQAILPPPPGCPPKK
nr:RHS repeat-associated core domain-containing protein [Acidobacteriota bacterium]